MKLWTGILERLDPPEAALKAGFNTQTTIYQIVQYLIIFISLMLVVLILTAIIVLILTLLCRKRPHYRNSVLKFSLVTLPIRLFTESFFAIFCVCMIEFSEILKFSKSNEKYLLSYNSSYYIFLSISILFVTCHLILIVTLFFFTTKSVNSKRCSLLQLLVNGLNTKKWLYVAMYFTHYLLIRLILGILIVVSVYAQSQYIWAGLIAI